MLVNGNLEVIGSTNIDLSQYVTSATFATLESRVSDLEPVVSNLVTTTESHTTAIAGLSTATAGLTTATAGLRTDLDNLILAASSGTYVLLTTFNAVIGDLTAVNGVMNNLQSDDSIAETLEDIYERLTWQEISE
jgi:acyl-CoA synthetase (NDP forming)